MNRRSYAGENNLVEKSPAYDRWDRWQITNKGEKYMNAFKKIQTVVDNRIMSGLL